MAKGQKKAVVAATAEPVFPGLEAGPVERLSDRDAELFSRHVAGDAGARNEIVERYFALVDLSVDATMKLIREAMEEGDLRQAGVVGFMEAVTAWRVSPEAREQPFEEFCSLRIRQAVMEELFNCVGERPES